MKVNLKISAADVRGPSPANRSFSRGIALIVTLIMLSVITFMTVTFLVLSQRERGSVTTSTEQLIAKQAAETALERAKIELIAPMLAQTNSQLNGLLVSTNFINPHGFVRSPALGANTFTNVNFDYTDNNAVLNESDRLSLLTNLMYNPRVPVYMTNRELGVMEFRYYLDLNRNRRYDTNGFLPVIDYDGDPVVNGGETNFHWALGDPEWIGVLERPELPHSSTNKFVYRYAYFVVPSGKTLDINYIHNQAKRRGSNEEGFLRNQGVGSYEINLAAFLTDLNTNRWFNSPPAGNGSGYDYRTGMGVPSVGAGFDDALTLLRYRYSLNGRSSDGSYNNLLSPLPAFDHGNIDEYANGFEGQLMTNSRWMGDLDDKNIGFPGADNPSHFFNTQELFDRAKLNAFPINFVDRLSRAGTNVSSYDRETYYRLLAQLGTDSEPDRRMNLNYRNVDAAGNVVPGMETNMVHWTPLEFFTNAANRLIRAQFPNTTLSVTNIPVFENNTLVYPPVVNRLLQVAANMYEATTNSQYPTLFRPYFSRYENETVTNVFISGFEQVTDPVFDGGNSFLTIPLDLNEDSDRKKITEANPRHNIYGVPWIIGSRKGLPNVNEVAFDSVFQIHRRIQISRANSSSTTFGFQQQYVMEIAGALGVEAWNSYSTNFDSAQVWVTGSFDYSLTNSDGYKLNPPRVNFTPTVKSTNNWAGYGRLNRGPNDPPNPLSFQIPLRTNFFMLTNSIYSQSGKAFLPTNQVRFEPVSTVPIRWGLSMTNRLRVIICDEDGRIFDYVQLGGPTAYRDLSGEILTSGSDLDGLWNTNLTKTIPPLPEGVNYQLLISMGRPELSDSEWSGNGIGPVTASLKDSETAAFSAFYLNPKKYTNLVWQLPFTPARKVELRTSWQANDPLVHYLADDLVDIQGVTSPVGPTIVRPGPITNLLNNIGRLNERYIPWDGNPPKGIVNPFVDINPALKDPLVRMSDDWEFPTNKLASLGWLGRVHRGTPWQTVYMKSADILNPIQFPAGVKDWQEWTGYYGATNAVPATDRLIFDLFTAAPNENAGRGRLPINQENLAAWSAVLSGVVVQTNGLTGGTTIIQPAAIHTNLASIVEGINATRANTNGIGPVFPERQFAKLGDVLATPQLTDLSPYLPTKDPASFATFGIDDAMLERIPQQVMSLLSFNQSPRFVIYAYGQSLRPAENSIIRSFGQFRGMCTNYQVTAESARRVVIRVDGSLNPADSNHYDPARRYPPRMVVEQYNLLPPD